MVPVLEVAGRASPRAGVYPYVLSCRMLVSIVYSCPRCIVVAVIIDVNGG